MGSPIRQAGPGSGPPKNAGHSSRRTSGAYAKPLGVPPEEPPCADGRTGFRRARPLLPRAPALTALPRRANRAVRGDGRLGPMGADHARRRGRGAGPLRRLQAVRGPRRQARYPGAFTGGGDPPARPLRVPARPTRLWADRARTFAARPSADDERAQAPRSRRAGRGSRPRREGGAGHVLRARNDHARRTGRARTRHGNANDRRGGLANRP